MNWILKTLSTGIGKKVFMALTGLFLIVFLLGHLAGNLQLLDTSEVGKIKFNEYAHFMTTNPAVKILSYVTYFSILLHVVIAVTLRIKNKKARPIGYHSQNESVSSSLSARNMGILGTLVLVFLIFHMKQFFAEMHWGGLAADANGNTDLHSLVVSAYHNPLYAVLYVIAMIIVSFHLSHGFQSAFQTLGINHLKYTPTIKKAGTALSVIICGLFAIIPIWVYFH